MVKTKLTASDSACSAIVAVMLGALIALGLQLLSGRERPKRLLKQRRQAILGAYVDSGWPTDSAYERIAVDVAAVKAYSETVAEAIRKYLGSVLMVDQESEAYKQIDSSIALAEADAKVLTSAGGLEASLDALAAEVRKVRTMLAGTYDIVRTPELLARAAAPLAAGKMGVGDASERAKYAAEMTPLLREWRQLARRVLGYEIWLIALGKRAKAKDLDSFKPEDLAQLTSAAIGLAELREEIFRATRDSDLDRLRTSYRIEAVFAKLSYLGGEYDVAAPPEPEPVLREAAKVGVATSVEDGFPGVAERSPDLTADDVSWTVRRLEPTSAAAATISQKRYGLLAIDLLVLVVGTVTAIVVALAAVYFGKAFGSFEDYLTVIVVGAASQGLVTALQSGLAVFMHDFSATADVARPTAKIAAKPA